MNSITLLHNFLTNTTNILNLVLSIELAIACICGLWQGFWLCQASIGKIGLVATITAIMFRLWQSWPQEWVWFAVLPQCAFWVFAGGLVGCTLKWGIEQTVARN
jgi:hypothetical protein